ncbi:hypothetical protein PBV87_15375 [Niameybacter massiliensis]|uniref:Uncharacterized protein n=1 Tax=Holtiella tumoricola TaxID=3018743 RepID=A0AA42J1Q9_9FIRM|nr:hypothetical protein [Holtiella tumoricola]MDA3732857.1 hypothetical protein [Holtiella tumoricola]
MKQDIKKADAIIRYINASEGSEYSFSTEEKIVALNILEQLKGLTILKATKILKFCLKAICITKI